MTNLKRDRLTRTIARLEKRHAALSREQEAANDQYLGALGAADRVRLDEQIETRETEMQDIECEIEKLEKELARLDSQSADPNRRHLDFEGKIHTIDYSEVRETVARLIERARQDCAASLFLIQGGNRFGGAWCLDAMREELGRNRPLPIVPRNIGFRPDERKDRLALLDRIAGHFNVRHPKAGTEDPDAYAREIVCKIAAATHIGSAELIGIHGWDYLQKQDGLLEWFLRRFWVPLVRDFRAHEKRKNAKLIIVLVADGPSPEDLLRDHCCDEENYEEEKLLPLPLRHWHRHEIEAFLSSGVVEWAGTQTIEELAEMIHGSSEGGMPRLACEALRKHVFSEV